MKRYSIRWRLPLSYAGIAFLTALALGAMLPPPGKDSDYLKALAMEIPLQRVGGAEVVAEAVLFLLRNDFVTGEIIRVDGGAHLR